MVITIGAKQESVHTNCILRARQQGPWVLVQEQEGELTKLNVKKMMIYCCEKRIWQNGRNFTCVL